MRRILVLTCALALVMTAMAQEVVTGTVARVDPGAGVVVLNDGRMFQTSSRSVMMVNGQPVTLDTLQPGTPIVLHSAAPVVYQNGEYVVVTRPAAVVSQDNAVVGEVSHVSTADRTIYFMDGRKVELRPDSVVIVDNTPAPWGSFGTGSHVVVERPGRITETAPSASYGAGPTDENYDVTGSPYQAP